MSEPWAAKLATACKAVTKASLVSVPHSSLGPTVKDPLQLVRALLGSPRGQQPTFTFFAPEYLGFKNDLGLRRTGGDSCVFNESLSQSEKTIGFSL